MTIKELKTFIIDNNINGDFSVEHLIFQLLINNKITNYTKIFEGINFIINLYKKK